VEIDVANITLQGFPFSFGIFQDYYRSSPEFEGASGIAVIGTCAMVMNLPTNRAVHRLTVS
jgi:hypothetical protein